MTSTYEAISEDAHETKRFQRVELILEYKNRRQVVMSSTQWVISSG